MTSATHQDTLPFAPQHAPMRVSRPTVSTQKIRVATTMTGGVSLAIWMGGVTRELNLLTQASTWRKHLPSNGQALPEIADATDPDQAVRELYLRLIDLLDVTVTTDVLSGTSAGGINAALLALSRARGVDLASQPGRNEGGDICGRHQPRLGAALRAARLTTFLAAEDEFVHRVPCADLSRAAQIPR